ncbi:MAG: cell wall-active antibiotics response protein, partial [Tannerellaceae bacterium]|nr:cell wall-active antibiotics response protein [Tannerellaceae bacterium]
VVPLAIGAYFLLPRITGEESVWLSTYWPAFLVLIGLLILFSRRKNPWHTWSRSSFHPGNHRGRVGEQISDGYVTANVSFGNSRHIVLDPVFRGADLEAAFGTMSLDLRRTSLEAPETYINVDCSFGGVVISVPPHWCLLSEMENSFGSSEDKRYLSQEIDTEHKLIIRGDVSFGALEIKN